MESTKTYTANRKARHDYHILDTMICGIILKGCEVKSIVEGNLSIAESFITIDKNNEVWLENCHIDPYKFTNNFDKVNPTRKRKLLLNKHEIRKLSKEVKLKGNTIIPLSFERINNKVKVIIGLAKGKNKADKRHALKEKQIKRDLQREKKML